eukprot:5465829-Pyramimonas_sp.AAC.1
MSGRLCNAATWPQPTTAQFNRHRAGIVRIYRSAIGRPAHDQEAVPDTDVLAIILRCDVAILLRWHRLRYLSRLY